MQEDNEKPVWVDKLGVMGMVWPSDIQGMGIGKLCTFINEKIYAFNSQSTQELIAKIARLKKNYGHMIPVENTEKFLEDGGDYIDISKYENELLDDVLSLLKEGKE